MLESSKLYVARFRSDDDSWLDDLVYTSPDLARMRATSVFRDNQDIITFGIVRLDNVIRLVNKKLDIWTLRG